MANTEQVLKDCLFCTNKSVRIEPKDAHLLRRFISTGMKILPRRRSGLCALHQRKIARAIKQARTLAILPYLPE